MKNLYVGTRLLDAACRTAFGLSEEVMMENAAAALERVLMQRLSARRDDGAGGSTASTNVLILCGSGNNGADGYALSRRLMGAVHVTVAVCAEPKSALCILQADRARRAGVPFVPVSTFFASDGDALVAAQSAIIDCIFGSGFHGTLNGDIAALLALMQRAASNAHGAQGAERCLRIACDVPTGLCEDGTVAEHAFCADVTVTMGALKLSLFSDAAKDLVGTIEVGDLGVTRRLFEANGENAIAARLLETSDLALPERTRCNVHKGTFGHAVIASGEKIGASCIAGTAALRFGAGLVTLVRLGEAPFTKQELPQVPFELMTAHELPHTPAAVAVGMGLGRTESACTPWFSWLSAHSGVPCVIDADACYADSLPALLQTRAAGIVLTPHPKEFAALLATCGIESAPAADGSRKPLSAEEALRRRPALMEAFCRAYPSAVLLVKGANPMIGCYANSAMQLYVNPLGTAALAKAGSGDVLAGLIAALLAQGYEPLKAACTGSLAHALASRHCRHSYALSPQALIDAVAAL